MALEKIMSAMFTSASVVRFETTCAVTSGTAASLKCGDVTVATASISADPTGFGGMVIFAFALDYTLDYRLEVSGIQEGAAIAKTKLIDSREFIARYENEDTQALEYGAIVSADKTETTFRVWAPFATSVTLNLYENGTGGAAYATFHMKKRVHNGTFGGVWECTRPENLDGVYYKYTVVNYGVATETIDPYAKACGANGSRGMVVDFSTTDPEDWAQDKHLYKTSPEKADTPIVWEVQVKDFSSSPDSGMKYKGKYLAFTERDTTVPGSPELKTGVNYLKDLGITYVHLNPVYDFATVDENDRSIADDTKDTYNWGYDPQNYNIPEGSYATDSADGKVRINEFKRMVKALHDAGIGVIMDVVYNHTYATNGQALNNTVPFYYHRTNTEGKFSNDSGCGNGTASERAMMRKYITESVLYWATEYHIDGFRFDLMGIHDNQTIMTVREALDALDGGNGKKLLMYGEPWSADGGYVAPSFTDRVAATSTEIPGTGKYTFNDSNNKLIKSIYGGGNVTSLPERVAIFNDNGRDGLRGNNDPGRGWANGNPDEEHFKKVQRMMEGGCGMSGMGLVTSNGAQNVAYASAHDNYPLWDQLINKFGGSETPLYYDNAAEYTIAQCKLVSTAYMTSSGIAFMLAGEEMARTKYGNHNSYNSPEKLNRIVWSRQSEFADLHAHYKALIHARLDYSKQLFSYSKSTEKSFCTGNFSGSNESAGKIVFVRTKNGTELKVMLAPGGEKGGSGKVTIGDNTIVEF